MRALVLVCCWAVVLPEAVLRAEAPRVSIVLTSAGAYREAADALNEKLTQQGCECTLIQLSADRAPSSAEESGQAAPATPTTAPADDGASADVRDTVRRLRESRPSVIVTIGGSATSLALQAVPDTPVVFCMVPNALDRSFMEKGSPKAPRLVGVTMDISPDLQVEQIRRLSPKATNVGVFHGPRSRRTAEAVKAAAEKKGLRLTLIPTQVGQFAEALRLLDQRDCDAALMIADAEVYNSANVQALLLWGLRGRKPVWTFSPNLVKSGAFAALHADTAGLATQTVKLVEKVLHGSDPAERGLRYPEVVRGGINERTAEMIGISLDRQLYDSVAVRFQKQ